MTKGKLLQKLILSQMLIIFLFFGVISVSAETELINDKAIIDTRARKYVNEFHQAKNKPGVPILVNIEILTKKLKPLFKKEVSYTTEFIIYDYLTCSEIGDDCVCMCEDDIYLIEYLSNTSIREENSYWVLFNFIPLIFMLMFNALIGNRKSIIIAIWSNLIAIASTIILGISFYITFGTLRIMPIFISLVCSVCALIFSYIRNRGDIFSYYIYSLSSGLFYVFMIMQIINLYIP